MVSDINMPMIIRITKKQQYLPSEIEGEHFYELSDMGYEKKLKEHMKKIHEEAK